LIWREQHFRAGFVRGCAALIDQLIVLRIDPYQIFKRFQAHHEPCWQKGVPSCYVSISPLDTNLALMAGFGKPNCRNFAHMARMRGLNDAKCVKHRRYQQRYMMKISPLGAYLTLNCRHS
jgi:hypothetical protein